MALDNHLSTQPERGPADVTAAGPMADADAPENAPGPTGSLAVNSTVRLASDLGTFVLSIVSAIVTARWLGPSDKGVLSTLMFVAALAILGATMGLGDAAIVEMNRRRTSLATALSSTVAAVALLACIGAAAVLGISWLLFSERWSDTSTAVVLAAVAVPVSALSSVLSQVLNAGERITLTSAVAFLGTVLSTIGLGVFIVALGWSVAGGVLATLAGAAIGLLILIGALGPGRAALRPRWDRAYLSRAIRYGVVVQLSYLVLSLAARADLLVVYELSGSAAAGQYSVSLTLGTLVAYAAAAMMYAGFPRLAGLDEAAALELTGRIFRLGTAAATVTAAALLVFVPLAVGPLFGSAYDAATLPALLLLPGGIFYSGQFILSRSSAAAGHPGVLIRTFGTSLATMLLLDLLLVPIWGISGAALAATLSSAAGLAVCIAHHRRAFDTVREELAYFVPRAADFVGFGRYAIALVTGPLRARKP
jgi:O-antigen/teichoic acid export membrane protein